MALTKLVNGVAVQMTAEEEAAFEASRIAGPTPIPQSVTRRQAKEALRRTGKLAAVQTAIDAIVDLNERARMQIEWDESLEFERTRPSLIAIGGAIGLDSAGIDQLFILAKTL